MLVMTLYVYMLWYYRKQRIFSPARQDVSAYNPITASQERRYAIISDDRFESSTIRRMSMRSSVFEKRKLLTQIVKATLDWSSHSLVSSWVGSDLFDLPRYLTLNKVNNQCWFGLNRFIIIGNGIMCY